MGLHQFIIPSLRFRKRSKKELLGIWLSENEGAKSSLGILTEQQNRGVQDILSLPVLMVYGTSLCY